MESQNQQIRSHLNSGKSLTPRQALDLFGCFRLAARIYELKKLGFEVEKNMIFAGNPPNHKMIAQYRKKPLV